MAGIKDIRLGVINLVVALLCGCYNRFDAASKDGDAEELIYNMTIERLHELTASQDYFDVKTDVVIRGAVTANDVGGNLYCTFVIEQEGYAVEVMEGLNYTYVRYGEGCVVTVDLNGLRLSRSYGVLQVGLATSDGSYYDLDYLGHEYLIDQHITNSGIVESVTPLEVTLEELYEESQYEAMCGRLISVVGVRFLSEDYDLDERVWSGSRVFADADGRELGCYTSSYAYYSMVDIEEGYATITGILEFGTVNGSSSPMVKMRSLADFSLLEYVY